MTTSVQLLSAGIIDFDLHHGIHAKDWWWKTPQKNNEFCPGYCCQCKELSSEVEKNPTDAVSKLYQNINPNSTRRISGAEVLGFELDKVVQELLLNIEFRPYSIQIENNINLFICGLRSSNNNALCGAGNGYIAYSIKRYARLGCNVTEGSDIEKAINLKGTSVANLPTEGQYAGYIRARSLPNTGEWKKFSPVQIQKFLKVEVIKLHPQISIPTKSNIPWTSSIPKNIEANKSKTSNTMVQPSQIL
nr:9423_t:CDS:2 [Entrophospora candida]